MSDLPLLVEQRPHQFAACHFPNEDRTDG